MLKSYSQEGLLKMLKLNCIEPAKFMGKLLSKKPIDQSDFDKFKSNIEKLKQTAPDESEEHQKNNIRDFLINTYGYDVNTSGRIDATIKTDNTIQVIIEAKSSKNKTEMLSSDDTNKKALHECILYFMRERENNPSIKHIIVTNFIDWYIFDAKEFDKQFWQNKSFNKQYKNWNSGDNSDTRTTAFYNEIAKPFCAENDIELTCCYFNINEYTNDKQWVQVFKLLTPDTLLKQFNPNDANSLNKDFYNELLYILGLEETKNGGKKIIGQSSTPQTGSIYENIAQKLSQYGKPSDFESVVRLIIIWINRILFLKLLESQVIG